MFLKRETKHAKVQGNKDTTRMVDVRGDSWYRTKQDGLKGRRGGGEKHRGRRSGEEGGMEWNRRRDRRRGGEKGVKGKGEGSEEGSREQDSESEARSK